MSVSPHKPTRLLSRASLMVAAMMIGGGLVNTPKAKAANLYWDNDATAAGNNLKTGTGLGGAGVWGAADAKWFDGSSAVAWTNANGDTASFVGAGGLVSLGSAFTVGGLHFGAVGLTTLANSSLTFTGATPAVTQSAGARAAVTSGLQLGATTTFDLADILDVRGGISGVGGLTKQGSGLLVLRGHNTYQGETSVLGGMLLLAGQANTHDPLGVFGSAGTTVASGATLGLGPVNAGSTAVTLVENLSLSGRGVGGNGALRLVMGANGANVNGNVDLLSATRVQADLAGTFSLNGIWDLDATLTAGGTNFISFGGTSRVLGANPLVHYGISGMRLQGNASTFSGPIISLLGEVRGENNDPVSGASPYQSVAGLTLRNTVLQLLLSSGASAQQNRFSDVAPIISRGSRIRVENNSFNNTTTGQNAVNWSEVLGTLTLVGGQTLIDQRDNASASVVRSVSLAAITRTDPSATLLLSGDGSAATDIGLSTRYQVINRSLTANVPFIGGWAYTNAEFLKYLAPSPSGFGYTAMVAADYAVDTAVGTWTPTQHVKVTTGNVALGAGSTTIRSLNFQGTTARILTGAAGSTLIIASGGLLSSGGAHAINAPFLTAGAEGDYHLYDLAWNSRSIASVITDNGANPVSYVKSSAGVTSLFATSTYTGATILNEGYLRDVIGARTAAPALSAANLVFAGSATQQAAYETDRDFLRALGTGAGQVRFTGGTGSGFGAYGAPISVNFGGAGETIQWGSPFFNPGIFTLNGGNATHAVTLVNGLDLGGEQRYLRLDGGASAAGRGAIGFITGDITNGSLIRRGGGILWFTDAKSYAGGTQINEGELWLSGAGRAGADVIGNDIQINQGGRLRVESPANIGANQLVILQNISNDTPAALTLGSGYGTGAGVTFSSLTGTGGDLLGGGLNFLIANNQGNQARRIAITLSGLHDFQADLMGQVRTIAPNVEAWFGADSGNATFTGPTLSPSGGATTAFRLGGHSNTGGTLVIAGANVLRGAFGLIVGAPDQNDRNYTDGIIYIPQAQGFAGTVTVGNGGILQTGVDGSLGSSRSSAILLRSGEVRLSTAAGLFGATDSQYGFRRFDVAGGTGTIRANSLGGGGFVSLALGSLVIGDRDGNNNRVVSFRANGGGSLDFVINGIVSPNLGAAGNFYFDVGDDNTNTVANGMVTINGVIDAGSTGAQVLRKRNGGMLVLNADNLYDGNTLVEQGRLILGHAGAAGIASTSIDLAANSDRTARLEFRFDGTAPFVLANAGITTTGGNDGSNRIFVAGARTAGNENGVVILPTLTVGHAGTYAAGGGGNSTLYFDGFNGYRFQLGNIVLGRSIDLRPRSGLVTVNGVISGATFALGKNEQGVLWLNGANTYTGGTTVTNGYVVAGNDAAFGNSATAVQFRNNTFSQILASGVRTLSRAFENTATASTQTLGGLDAGAKLFSGALTLTRGIAVTAAVGGDVTFTGAITGVGGLTKVGAGRVILAPTTGNAFAGGIAVTEGELVGRATAAGSAFGANSAFTLSDGVLRFANATGAANTTASTGGLAINSGNATVVVEGGGQATSLAFGSLTRTANATLTLKGVDTDLGGATNEKVVFTAAPTLVNGLIGPWAVIQGAGASAAANFAGYAAGSVVTATYGATGDLDLAAGATQVFDARGTASLLTADRSVYAFVANQDVAFGGRTLRVGAAPGGTLGLAGIILNAGADLTGAAGSTLQLGTNALSLYVDSAGVSAIGVPLANTRNNASNTFANVLTKFGPGTLSLTASSPLQGDVRVSEGVLSLDVANAFATAGNLNAVVGPSVIIHPGATVDLNGRAQEFANLGGSFVQSPVQNIGGTLLMEGATLTVGRLGTNWTYSGQIVGGAGSTLVKIGAGTLTLDNWEPTRANSLDRAFVDQGTLTIIGGDQSWVGPLGFAPSLPGTTDIFLRGGTFSVRVNGDSTGNLQRIALGYDIVAGGGDSILNTVRSQGSGANKLLTFGTLSLGLQRFLTNNDNTYVPRFDGVTTLTNFARVQTDSNLVLAGLITGPYSLEKRGGSDLAIGADNRAWDGGLVATDGTILFGSRGTDDIRFEGTTFVPLTSANAGTGDIVVNRGTTIRLNTPANVLTAEGSTVQFYGTLATTVTTVQLGTDAAPSAYGLRSTGVGALALQMNEGNFATVIDQSLVGNGQWGLAAASGTTYVAPTLGAGADGVYRFFGSNSATLNITSVGALSGTASLQVGISQLENGFALGNGVANIRLYGDQSWTGATTVFRNREAGSTQNFLEFHGDLATSAFHVYGRLTARGAGRFTDDAGAQVNVVNLYPGSALRIDYNNDVADTAFTSRLDASNLATAQQENKWGDTTPLFLNGAGLTLVSTNTRVNREEVGAITVAQGASVYLERTGTNGQIILSAPSVTRVGQATFAVRENADELGRIDLQGQKFFLANGVSMLDARGLLPVWMLNPARNGFLTYSASLGVQNAAFTSSFTTGDSAAGATFLAGLTSASVANFIGGTADPTLAGTVNVHALRVQANTNDNEATFTGGQINLHSGGLVTINANAAGRVNFNTTALYFGNGTTPTEGILYVGGNGLITRSGGVVTAAGLTVHGEGNLQLTNTANAITGTLQLNGGVLYLDGVGTAGTATIALGGDWLANNDGSQMPELRFRTVNADATWTSNGVRVLADVPYFRIFGQSTLNDSLTTARTNTIPTLTIDGTSTLQGTTFLFGNTGNGNNANNYNLAVSGATTLGGTAPIAFRVERGGTNVQGGAGFLLLNGAVSGAAPIIKSGDGILRFSGNNTALTSPVTLVRGELRGFGDTNNNVFGTGDYFLNYGTLRTSANDARTYFAAPGQDLVIGGAVTVVSDRNGGATGANRTFGANAGTNSIRTVNGAQLRFNADSFGDDYYLEGKLVVRDSALLANDSADLFLRDVLEGTGRLIKGGIWYAYLDHNAASSGWTGRFDIQQGSFRVNQDAATLGASGASVVVNPSSVLSLRSAANLGGASLEVRTTSAFNLTTLGLSTAAGQTALYDLFDGLTMVGSRAGVLALDNGATFTAAPDMAAFRGGDWYLGSNSGGTLTAASLAPWGAGGAQFLLGGGAHNLTLNPAAVGAQLAGAGNSLVVGVANAGFGHVTLILGANSANTFGGGTLVTRSRNMDGYRGSVLILQGGQAAATTFRPALGTGVVDVFGEVRIEATNGTVRGSADANANTWVFHPGSRIRFDNDNPLSTASTQGRWADTAAMALNAAVLELYGDGAASAYNTETIGALSVAGGSEVVLRRRGAFLAELITGDLTRVGAGTLMVTGMDTNTNTSSGIGVSGATAMRMLSTNGATLMTNGMVAPWITERVGNQFLKYDAVLGFMPITTGTTPANYITSAGGTLTVAANDGTTILNLGTANATLGANLDLHALRLDRDINTSADGAFGRITIRSGGLMQVANTPTINPDLYFGAAGDGTGEALIWASNNTLQINGRIFASQVNKSGTAFLNVRADQPQFAGPWVVNGGGIQFLTPGAQGTGAVTLAGSRMTDRDNTFVLSEVRYNYNSGSPDLFTWTGGAITSIDNNRVYAVLANDRLQQTPALHLRTTNAVAGTGQAGTLIVQVDGFRSTLRTGAVTLHDHYQVFVESGSFGTGSTTGVQFGAGTGVGGLDNQSLFDFSKIGDGVLTLGDNSATFDGNRSLVVGEGALRVKHAGSLGAAGVNASIEQGGALEIAVASWSPLATLTLQPGSFERWAIDGARAGNYVLPAGAHLQVMQNQTGRRTVTLNGGSVMGYVPRDWDHVAVIQKLGADITLNLAADSFLGQPFVTSSNGVWDLSRIYDQGKINQANANNPTDPGLRGSYFQIDGAITGPGGLTKIGQDVILLAGASTYEGLTRVDNGVLQIGRADALPVTTGLILGTTSGSFDLNGYDQRVASLSGVAGVVTNGAFALNTLTVRQTTDTTFAGTLDGNVALRKEGAGVLTLAPVDAMGVTTTGNGYRGGSVFAGGFVSVAMDAALGDVPNAFDADNLVFAGGGLRTTASFALSAQRGLNVNSAGGVLDVPTGVTFTVSGATTGVGAFAKTGAGSVRLDGAIDLTGLTTVGAGVLEVSSGRLAGGLAGSGAFNKVGAGLLQLSGDSTAFSGQTTVAAGELRIATASSLNGLATAGRWSAASGATLSFADAVGQADVVAALASGNFVAGSFLGLDVAAERAFTADLAGAQGLTKSGVGVLALSGAGTFTGGVRLAGGTLAFTSGSLGSGSITFQGNSTLRWSGAQTTDLSARLSSVSAGLTAGLDLGANDVAFASGLAGAGNWTKSGTGVLSLNAVSALTGTLQVSAGTVRMGVASALPSAALVRIDANSTLDLDGNALGLTRLAGLGSLTNASATAATLSVGSAQDSSVGTLSGSLALTKNGTGNLSVGSATYAGATTLSAGRLTLSSGSLNGAIGGAGVLTKAGNGVLTLGGAGTYAGGLEVLGGTLRLASADAADTVGIRFGDATIEAVGGTRTFGGAVTFLNNATQVLAGTHAFTFTNIVDLGGDVTDVTFRQNVAGQTVTFVGGLRAAQLTLNGAWTVDGAGDTLIQGDLTGAGGHGFNLVKNGSGTLTLALGGASNFTQRGAAVIVRRGTLALGADEVIPHGAGAGGLIFAPEAYSADTATFDLRGRAETVTGLTAVSNGTLVIDNSSATPATLTVGADGAAVTLGGGAGSYTVTDSGAGALSFAKTGAGAGVVADGVVLSYQGATSVTGGSLIVRSPLTASTSLSVTGTGSLLALEAGHSAPSVVTAVTVGAGATLSLADGARNAFTALTSLQLGSASGTNTTLELNVGDLSSAGDGLRTDVLGLTAGGALSLFAGNKVTFNLVDAGLGENQTYTLVSAANGGLTSGVLGAGDWLLGATPGGFASLTLAASNGAVTLTTGSLVSGDLFWQGATSTNWSAGLASWSTDLAGTVTSTVLPGQASAVRFQRDSAAAAAITSNLDRNFRVRSLAFAAGTSAGVTPTSVTLAAAGGRLDLSPASASQGISLETGASASVVLAAPVRLISAQTWTVTDAAGMLTVSGALSGGASVTQAGLGRVTLSGIAAPEFNPAGNATYTVSAGSLIQTHPWALGRVEDKNLMRVIVQTGGAYYFSDAVTQTVALPLELAGGTLSVNAANQVYGGAVTVSANSIVNLRDANSAVTTTTARQVDLLGVLAGAGRLTLESIDTAGSGNRITGNLRIAGANPAWTGGMRVNAGTVIAAQAASLGTGPLEFAFGKLALQGQNGESWTLPNAIVLPDAGVAEFNVDNMSAATNNAFTATLTGPVSLGVGSALRIYLSDGIQSSLSMTGNVTLAGPGSISLGGAGTGGTAHLSGVISGAFALGINDDLGGWAQTNRNVRLSGVNTFTGDVTVAGGELEFTTVTAAGGAASSLGSGNNLLLNGGSLVFVGTTSQTTNRVITGTAAVGLGAKGQGGASITYTAPIASATFGFNLFGDPGSVGVIAGGLTSSGNTDANLTGGVWTFNGASPVTLGDDFVVTGIGTVLNLDATGVLFYNVAASGDASLLLRNGAVVNLGADNAVVAADFDRLFLSQDSDGAASVLNMGVFALTTSRLILGERSSQRTGDINGTGLLTVTGGDIDLYRGTIRASLASNGTSSFEKFGNGFITLAGDNRGLASTGSTVVNEGTLRLDFSADNNDKIRAASSLNMQGGVLELLGNAAAATTQTVAGFAVAAGYNQVTLTPGSGQPLTLAFGALTRTAAQGVARLNAPAGASYTTSTANSAHGLLGATAFLTVRDAAGATSFAANDGAGAIVGRAVVTGNDAAAWTVGAHVTDAGAGFTGTAGRSTLGSLRFDAAAGSRLTLANQAALVLNSGGLLVTDRVVAGSAGITGGLLRSASGEIVVVQESARSFEITSAFGFGQTLTKAGNGVLRLSGQGLAPAVNLLTGTLELAGQSTGSLTFGSNQDARVRVVANSRVGTLSGGRVGTESNYGVLEILPGVVLSVDQSTSAGFSAVLTGSGTFNQVGVNNFNYNATSLDFTGAVTVNAGLFQLSGNGRIGTSSVTVNRGGAFLFDNNGGTRSADRVPDGTPIVLNSANGTFGGQTQLRGLALRTDQNAGTNETIGSLVFGSGASYLTGSAGGGANAETSLVATTFERRNFATVVAMGRSLGLTADATGRNNFRIGDATAQTAFMGTQLVGGAGAAATTTISIVPWAFGENLTAEVAVGNMGNSLVTYVTGAGFRPLAFANEYATYALAGATGNVRESLTASLTGLAGKTVNSVVINNNNTAASGLSVSGTGAGQGLVNTSGAFLFTLNPAAAASSAHTITLDGFGAGITVGASAEYVFGVINPSAATNTPTLAVTVASALNTPAALTKTGRGTLVLSAVNAAGGGAFPTVLNEGVLQIADLDNIGGNAGPLVFGGGTLRLAAGFSDSVILRPIDIREGGATLDLGADISIPAGLGAGPGGFTKLGTGALTLGATAAYQGATTIAGAVTLTAPQALPAGTVLTLGVGTQQGSVNFGAFDATLGGLAVRANSATASVLTIAPGRVLRINGELSLTNSTNGGITNLNITGGGSLIVNAPEIYLGDIGGVNTVVRTNLDLTGLASAELSTPGRIVIARLGDNVGTGRSVLRLSDGANLVLAEQILIGASSAGAGNGSPQQTLHLGAGTNVLRADSFRLGIGTRDSGLLAFAGAAGSVVIRDRAGLGRADFILGPEGVQGTGAGTNTVVDFSGRQADVAIATYATSLGAKTAANTNDLLFSVGTLDVLNLNMAFAKGTGASMNRLVIGGGTTRLGGSSAFGDAGTGSLILATAGEGQINITAGTVEVGAAVRRAGAGAASVTLNGGTLDLNGNAVGDATFGVTLNAQSGTLRDVGTLNGTGGLTKSTAGTLTLEGNSAYAGVTSVTGGKLIVPSLGNGVSASALGVSALTPANFLLSTGVTLGYAGAGETTGRGFTQGDSLTIEAAGTGALAFTSAAKVAFSTVSATRTLTLTGTQVGANTFGAGLSDVAAADAAKFNLIVKDAVGAWVITNGETLKSTARIDVNGGLLGLAGGVLPLAGRVDLATGTTLRFETGNTDDLGSRIQLDAGAAVTLAVNSDVSFATSLAVAGAGTASVTKSGAGKLTLAAANTNISGGFTVAQGTLDVTHAQALGAAPANVNGGRLAINAVIANTVNVASGGTVGGGGSIATLNVVADAKLSPGNSPGTLTAGNAALFGGSIFEWQVQDAADVAKYDHFNVTGTLDLSGASSANRIVFKVVSLLGAGDGITIGNPLNFDTAFSAAPAAQRIKTFNLGTIASINLGANANINDVFTFDVSQFTYSDGSSSNAGLWSINWDSASHLVTVTAVPEPSTYGFGLGALALAAAAIRRRKRPATKA
jgi:autotransporter-associated beta strand protein